MKQLDDIAGTFLTGRHALWVGAGISFASGVPTVNPLRSRILSGLGLDHDDIVEVERAKVPFEALFEVLLSVTDCRELLAVFRGGEPSLGHQVAAQLVKHGLVQTIVTTNFDVLIEDALRSERVEFAVYDSDESYTSINWVDEKARIIKLHGTILDIDELALTIRRVAARQRADLRAKVIVELLENENEGGLVVMGYSCSDHFDVSPAARVAARPDRRITYVAHDSSGACPLIAPLRETHPDNPFAGYDAVSVTCATEEFLSAIWRLLSGGAALPLQAPAPQWEPIVDAWLEIFDRLEMRGFRPYVAGLVLKAANLWTRSNQQLALAISVGLAGDTAARALLATGNNYRDLGEYDQAENILRRAADFARQGGHSQTEARILNSLGIVAEDRGEHDTAINFYGRALKLSGDVSDRELEGKCHGNLGIAYKNRNADGDLLLALGHHDAAYKVAVEIGDKRSEGRTLGNIGLVYRAKKDVRTACEYYAKARAVAESLGDLLHVGIWLHNAGEDMSDVDPATARTLLARSKDIFANLGQAKFAQQSAEVLKQIAAKVQE